MAKKANLILRTQSGAALIVALIMIIVITLIALASSYTSIFEIKLSGNKRGSTDAFYAADTGISEITTNIANFNLNSYNATTNAYSPFSDSTNTTPNPTKAQVNITHTPTQSGPPRGMGFSAINLNYAYYQVQSVGKDQANSGSTATIQEEVVRLLPVQ
jgi:type IV pilus assembly protein PilX